MSLLSKLLRAFGLADRPPALEAPEKVLGTTAHQTAARGLSDRAAVQTLQYRNAVVKCSADDTHPLIAEFYRHFQKALEQRAYPLFAVEMHRSNARQVSLRDKGTSKAGPGQSPHNWGCAVDIIHLTRGWNLSKAEWDIIGLIGKEVARKRKIPIVWGGDWKFWDPAHWELANWRDLRGVFDEVVQSGARPSKAYLDPWDEAPPGHEDVFFLALELRADPKSRSRLKQSRAFKGYLLG